MKNRSIDQKMATQNYKYDRKISYNGSFYDLSVIICIVTVLFNFVKLSSNWLHQTAIVQFLVFIGYIVHKAVNTDKCYFGGEGINTNLSTIIGTVLIVTLLRPLLYIRDRFEDQQWSKALVIVSCMHPRCLYLVIWNGSFYPSWIKHTSDSWF